MPSGTMIDELYVKLGTRFDNANLNRFENRIKRARERLDRMAAPMLRIGAAAAGAIGGIGAVAYRFDKAMNNLLAATNVTEEELARLRETALLLGRTTQFSASQAADAMTELGRAGFDTEEILAAVPDVLNLAAAGAIELDRAAEITSKTLRAFNLPAEEAGRVADVLAKSASSAATDIDQMYNAMRQVAPTAAQFGISLEDTAAAMAALQDAGVRPETAGVGFRNFLLKLGNLTGDAKDAIEATGLSYEHLVDLMAQGKFLDILKNFKTAGLAVTDFAKIFGIENANVVALLTDNIDRIEELGAANRDAAGEAARQAEAQMRGLVGAVQRFKSAVEGVALALADSGIRDRLINMIETLNRVMDAFQNLPESTKVMIADMIAAGLAIGGLGIALKATSLALATFTPLITALKLAIGGLKVMAVAVSTAFTILSSPITLAAAAAASAGTAILALVEQWDAISEAFRTEGLLAAITVGWQAIRDKFAGIFNGLGDMAAATGRRILESFGVDTGWISQKWNAAGEVIGSALRTIASTVVSLSGPILNTIGIDPEWVADRWNAARDRITGIVTSLAGNLRASGEGIVTDLATNLASGLAAAIGVSPEAVNIAWTTAVGYVRNALKLLTDPARNAGDALMAAVGISDMTVGEAWQRTSDSIGSAIDSITVKADEVREAITAALGLAGDVRESAWLWTLDKLTKALEYLEPLIRRVSEAWNALGFGDRIDRLSQRTPSPESDASTIDDLRQGHASGLVPPPAADAQVAPAPERRGFFGRLFRGGNTSNNTANITINTQPGQDANEIANTVNDRWRDQFQTAVENAATDIDL